VEPKPPNEIARKPVLIDFALQGGGSHGAVCGSTHRESYRDIVIVGIVGAVIALVVVIAIGSMVGFF